MVPTWVFGLLVVILAFIGSGIWHFHSQKDPDKVIWTALAAWCVLGLVVALYLRNDVIQKQTATAREKGGLDFKEVPSRRLSLPDEFNVDFGTNTLTFPRSRLAQQIPFEEMTRVLFPGKVPLRMFFDQEGRIRVDATLYDARGQIAAQIKGNEFSVLNARWDRNWDATGFEIVDENSIPFFQIERPRENLLRIRGIFRTSTGALLVSSDSGMVLNPTRPVPAPAALFKYPSSSNLGRRVGNH